MPLTLFGETVPDEILEQEFETIKAHYERMGAMSCCERDGEFRGYARENITARLLINREAARRFPDIPETEVQTAMDRLVEAEGGRAAFFAHAGLTEEEEPLVRREIATGLRVDRLMEEVWGAEPEPGEEALRKFYHQHREEWLTAEEVHALHLFKLVEKVEDRGRIYDQMRSLRREARAGADFAALALAHTDKEDKQVDLGFFRRGEFMEEFDLIVFSMEEGEISPVFASHWGFHLVKVVARRGPAPHPFETVRDAVRDRAVAEHRSLTTRALVDRLKAEAGVSGAAAGEPPESQD